jgi:hypothetical protein
MDVGECQKQLVALIRPCGVEVVSTVARMIGVVLHRKSPLPFSAHISPLSPPTQDSLFRLLAGYDTNHIDTGPTVSKAC